MHKILFLRLISQRMFILFIVWLSLLFSFFSPIQTQTHAQTTNRTDGILIDATVQNDKKRILLDYTIIQTFAEPGHGIFLSLPKNQDGIWTDYKLITAQRSIRTIDTASLLDSTPTRELNLSKVNELKRETPLINERIGTIKEWDQFRIRLGNPNQTLSEGKYLYSVVIEATLSTQYSQNFVLIKDWVDPVGSIAINSDNIRVCTLQRNEYGQQVEPNDCSPKLATLSINESQPSAPITHRIVSNIWPYIPLAVILVALGYGAWYLLARDPHKISKNPVPVFEPPQFKPWEAAYLANDGTLSLKNTLLAYILWLNNQKYISINVDQNDHGNKKSNVSSNKIAMELLKPLPDELPQAFNDAVSLAITEGMDVGIKESQLQEKDMGNVFKQIRLTMMPLFTNSPIGRSNAIVYLVLTGLILFYGVKSLYELLKEVMLLGESYLHLMTFVLLGLICITAVVYFNWSKPTKEGVKVIEEVRGYRYYLEYAEKLKLDFSNNPNDGVQYYLKSLPYAAAFGILAQFNAYFEKIMPNLKETATYGAFYSNYNNVSFYVPPSSSSSSGGGGGFSGGGGSW